MRTQRIKLGKDVPSASHLGNLSLKNTGQLQGIEPSVSETQLTPAPRNPSLQRDTKTNVQAPPGGARDSQQNPAGLSLQYRKNRMGTSEY